MLYFGFIVARVYKCLALSLIEIIYVFLVVEKQFSVF